MHLAANSAARNLKRVFKIDVEVCEHYGGTVKIIACIQRSEVIERIVRHVRGEGRAPAAGYEGAAGHVASVTVRLV